MTEQKTEPDLSSWLTREDVVDLLNCGLRTVDRWVAHGLLHPRKRQTERQKGIRMVDVFNPREIVKLTLKERKRPRPTHDANEIAARAFDSFAEGIPLREIVVRIRQTPEAVEKLYEQWKEFGGNDLIISASAKLELERHVGRFETVAELCDHVAACCAVAIDAAIPDGANHRDVDRAINLALDHEAKRKTP